MCPKPVHTCLCQFSSSAFNFVRINLRIAVLFSIIHLFVASFLLVRPFCSSVESVDLFRQLPPPHKFVQKLRAKLTTNRPNIKNTQPNQVLVQNYHFDAPFDLTHQFWSPRWCSHVFVFFRPPLIPLIPSINSSYYLRVSVTPCLLVQFSSPVHLARDVSLSFAGFRSQSDWFHRFAFLYPSMCVCVRHVFAF